jgi:uncharacterized protein YdhG (YjbR/CyaY superfamily)
MAKKGPMPVYKTIDDYIFNQSEKAQPILQELRNIIKQAAPDVLEIPNYKVPSFTLVPGTKPDQQLMMAGYASFVSFYPFPATVKHFSAELNDYDQGKGSIKFPLNKPLPKDLIIRMVKFRKAEILKK